MLIADLEEATATPHPLHQLVSPLIPLDLADAETRFRTTLARGTVNGLLAKLTGLSLRLRE